MARLSLKYALRALLSSAERKGFLRLYLVPLKDCGVLLLPKKSQDVVVIAAVAATAAAVCFLFDFWFCCCSLFCLMERERERVIFLYHLDTTDFGKNCLP